jgi:peptidoglycan/LPS O-acetylase OafA/YrhL
MQFVQRYLAWAPVSAQFAIYVSCAVGLSIAVYLVIERPARTLIRRALLNGHASIAKPSAPPTG